MTIEAMLDTIEQLTAGYDRRAQVKNWVDNLQILCLPVAQSDGVDYVFTKDNWWRKIEVSMTMVVSASISTATTGSNGGPTTRDRALRRRAALIAARPLF